MGVLIYVLVLAPLSLPVYGAIVAGAFVLGVAVSQRVTRQLGVEDHQGIVWDETVGFWVTMVFVHPVFEAPVSEWLWIAAGFVLFRLFDILKPWPIKLLDRHVKGGFGIMIDDVLAGIFAAICLQAIHYYYPLG